MTEPIMIGDLDDDPENRDWLRNLNAAAAGAGISTSNSPVADE